MSSTELNLKFKIAKLHFEDFLTLFDWFKLFSELINPDTQGNHVILGLQGQLNGVAILFEMGLIHNKTHQSKLEDIVYRIAEETNGTDLTIGERADMICDAIKDVLLDMK